MDKPVDLITPDMLVEETNCSKLTAKILFDKFDIPKEKQNLSGLNRFGRGFGVGSACGAISGATYAINVILEDREIEQEFIEQELDRFISNFVSEFGGVNCDDIMPQKALVKETKEEGMQVYCSDMLSETVHEVAKIIHFVRSYSSPIMRRFNTID